MESPVFHFVTEGKGGRQLHQKDGPAVDRARINGAIKRNGKPGLGVETVKLVQQRDISAIGRIGSTVRQWHGHAQACVLSGIKDRKPVAGEWRLRGGLQV